MASNINPKIMIAISKQINELIKKKIDGKYYYCYQIFSYFRYYYYSKLKRHT